MRVSEFWSSRLFKSLDPRCWGFGAFGLDELRSEPFAGVSFWILFVSRCVTESPLIRLNEGLSGPHLGWGWYRRGTVP